MTDDKDCATLLKALREVPADEAGAGGIDIGRAILDGRRTIRRRRVVSGLAVVALVAVASTTPLLLDALRTQTVQPAGQNSRFDLWSMAFEVSPAGGFTPAEYQTGRDWQTIRLVPASPSFGAATARVTLYATGFDPQLSIDRAQELEPIGGQPAYLTYRDSGSVQMLWKYTDNGWAVVQVEGANAAKPDVARRIAERVRLGPGRPVKVPFTVSRATVGAHLEVTSVVFPLDGSEKLHKAEQHYELFLHPRKVDQGGPGKGPSQLNVWVSKPVDMPAENRRILGRPAAATDNSVTMLDLPGRFTATVRAAAEGAPNPNYEKIAASVQLVPGGSDDPLR